VGPVRDAFEAMIELAAPLDGFLDEAIRRFL
jgi:hypothetical protein